MRSRFLIVCLWAAAAIAGCGGAGTPSRSLQPPSGNPVEPTVETDAVRDTGDAADDPAIWVHPDDPSRSLIIGTNKQRGLNVYDLAGRTLQSVPDGRMNNVDLRQGIVLGGRPVAVVAATNRTDQSLALYALDPATLRLENVAAEAIPTGFDDPYGLCMYSSPTSGDLYVFANDKDDGTFRQWRLEESAGKLEAELVREFTVGAQSEGCAADDETGALYIAEEAGGLWRYSAEPGAGDRRVRLDTTESGRLTPDVEGVAIYYGPDGTGYLVVSNQGANNYAVYRRGGDNEFVGHFAVVANEALDIDGTSDTDGLDVVSASLGAAFPNGLFVAQDGRNIPSPQPQNFKLVPWERIATALTLP